MPQNQTPAVRTMFFHDRILPPADRLEFVLPMGPSVNKLYIGEGENRTITPFYRAWGKECESELMMQLSPMARRALPKGHYCFGMVASPRTLDELDPIDLDNRIKVYLDILHRMRITPDDHWLYSIVVSRDPGMAEGFTQMAVWMKDEQPLLATRPDSPPSKPKGRPRLPKHIGGKYRAIRR